MYEYDEAGNVIYDGVNWYAYDNENRLCAVHTDNAVTGGTIATGYLYDAEGRRIAKGTITAMTNPLPTSSSPLSASMCNPPTNGFAPTETYVLGQSGEQLSTYSWSGPAGNQTSTWVRTNVYGADGLLATYDVDGQGQPALHFLLTDQVGTRRMQTNPAGTPESECQSLPYGDGLNCFAAPNAPGTADQANALYFTGKQRDPESGGGSAYSGNDYFGARYYASNAGRFMSPDPSGLYYADPGNPQSLNLYSYVQNNPLSNVDPNGLDCIHINVDTGEYENFDSGDCDNSTEEKANSGVYVDGTVNTITTTTGDDTGRVTGYSGTAENGNLITGSFFDLGQPLATPTQPDSDQEFVDALVQGVAQDTRSFPTLCNIGANLRAQIPNTPLSVGVSADRNGVHPLGRVSATGPNGGVGVSTNGKNTSVQVAVPFSAVLNGSVSTSKNKVTLGVSKSVNFGGKLSAGGSVTLGYIGDASCR